MFLDRRNHHAKTTQITTNYQQATTFFTLKTTTKIAYPQTLTLSTLPATQPQIFLAGNLHVT
jgi:hypothetical protein